MPLPSHRLASIALRALKVDEELSPLVRRSFQLVRPAQTSAEHGVLNGRGSGPEQQTNGDSIMAAASDEGFMSERDQSLTVLRTEYRATTNRMLRVAVNGFMESLGVVLGVMQELDVDVLNKER